MNNGNDGSNGDNGHNHEKLDAVQAILQLNSDNDLPPSQNTTQQQ